MSQVTRLLVGDEITGAGWLIGFRLIVFAWHLGLCLFKSWPYHRNTVFALLSQPYPHFPTILSYHHLNVALPQPARSTQVRPRSKDCRPQPISPEKGIRRSDLGLRDLLGCEEGEVLCEIRWRTRRRGSGSRVWVCFVSHSGGEGRLRA